MRVKILMAEAVGRREVVAELAKDGASVTLKGLAHLINSRREYLREEDIRNVY